MKKIYSIILTEEETVRYYANKIIEDALADCSEFNYCMDIENGFVEEHKEQILERIRKDDRIADVCIDSESTPNTFDMVFWMDYCPYYYEENELSPQEESKYLKLFIDNIKEIEDFISTGTTRTLIRNFMNKNIENNNNIDFDDKDGIYYSIKEHICKTGFNDSYIDKYEVYLDKDNIKELRELLENELEKINQNISNINNDEDELEA